MIILAVMKRIALLLLNFICILFACESGSGKTFKAAENGLDAGREFVDACLKGDFAKAGFYMLPNEKNTALIRSTEVAYREKDKEGRQELRLSSINIKEVSEPNDSTVIVYYSNSSDTTARKAVVRKVNNIWLVDYQKTFQ